MNLPEGKNIYFISDAHLGLPPESKSKEREKLLVEWLDLVKGNAHSIYFLGDMFDYWFEYRKVVPRGFVRFLGKLAELSDSGIEINYFTGNHDLWIFNYLPEETGVNVYKKPVIKVLNGKRFYIAHGDGLGPGDFSYKFLKKIFNSKLLQFLYALINPNIATWFAHSWSKRSRFAKGAYTPFKGVENEQLIKHAYEILKKEDIDYFIFGHRHIALDLMLNHSSRIIYTGDWFINFSYAKYNNKGLELKRYPDNTDDQDKPAILRATTHLSKSSGLT